MVKPTVDLFEQFFGIKYSQLTDLQQGVLILSIYFLILIIFISLWWIFIGF